jgi:hypothetical protein
MRAELESLFTGDKIDKFADTIMSEILSMSTNDIYLNQSNGYNFLTKVSFHQVPRLLPGEKDVDLTKYFHPSEAEIAILSLLKTEILDKKISPCIVNMLYEKTFPTVKKLLGKYNCDIKSVKTKRHIRDLIYDNLCSAQRRIDIGMCYPAVSFIFLEECQYTFDDYLKRYQETPINLAIARSFIFQIIYTLFAIKQIFPGFQHGDLHSNNVMLKINNAYHYSGKTKFILFKVDDIEFYVPYFGILVKIIDYERSVIYNNNSDKRLPENGIVSTIVFDEVSQFRRHDCDILMLFHDIENICPMTLLSEFTEELLGSKAHINFDVHWMKKMEIEFPSYREMLNKFSDYKGGVPHSNNHQSLGTPPGEHPSSRPSEEIYMTYSIPCNQ